MMLHGTATFKQPGRATKTEMNDRDMLIFLQGFLLLCFYNLIEILYIIILSQNAAFPLVPTPCSRVLPSFTS